MFIIICLLAILVAIANTELPSAYTFSPFDKYNQRPGDSSSYDYTQYNPNDYILNVKPQSPNQLYGYPTGYPEYVPQRPNYPQNFYNAPIGPIGPPIYPKPSSYYRYPQISQYPNKPLFTSNGNQDYLYPATQGQINNYNKALQEEKQQLQTKIGASGAATTADSVHDVPTNTAFTNGFTGYSNSHQQAKSYVNVKLGPQNVHYQYQV